MPQISQELKLIRSFWILEKKHVIGLLQTTLYLNFDPVISISLTRYMNRPNFQCSLFSNLISPHCIFYWKGHREFHQHLLNNKMQINKQSSIIRFINTYVLRQKLIDEFSVSLGRTLVTISSKIEVLFL